MVLYYTYKGNKIKYVYFHLYIFQHFHTGPIKERLPFCMVPQKKREREAKYIKKNVLYIHTPQNLFNNFT